jgi:hypothetical protein
MLHHVDSSKHGPSSSNAVPRERRPSSHRTPKHPHIHADSFRSKARTNAVRVRAERRHPHLACNVHPHHCQSLEYRTTRQLPPTNNYMSSAGERATATRGRKLHRRRNLPYSLRFLYCKTSISRLESAARAKRAATEGATHLYMRNLSGISTAGAAHPPVCSGRAVLDGDFWEYK